MTFLNLVVLALAGARLFRIIAGDSITQRWRQRLLGYDDDAPGRKNNWPANHKSIAEFVHCPYCLGFWIALVAWVAFRVWPHAVMLGAWPLAISALLGVWAARVDV